MTLAMVKGITFIISEMESRGKVLDKGMSWVYLNFRKMTLFASGEKDFRAGSAIMVYGGCLCTQYGGLNLGYCNDSRQ